MEAEEFNWASLGDVVTAILGQVAPERVESDQDAMADARG